MNILTPQDFLIDWENLPEERSAGLTGFATIRTQQTDNLKIRLLTYSEGYEADHWCTKGHIITVQEGSLFIDFKDGSSMTVDKGKVSVLGENNDPHKARTVEKAVVLIID